MFNSALGDHSIGLSVVEAQFCVHVHSLRPQTAGMPRIAEQYRGENCCWMICCLYSANFLCLLLCSGCTKYPLDTSANNAGVSQTVQLNLSLSSHLYSVSSVLPYALHDRSFWQCQAVLVRSNLNFINNCGGINWFRIIIVDVLNFASLNFLYAAVKFSESQAVLS